MTALAYSLFIKLAYAYHVLSHMAYTLAVSTEANDYPSLSDRALSAI